MPGGAPGAELRAVELALAAVERIAFDRLLTLGLAPHDDLLRWIEDAARRGWVAWLVRTNEGARAIAFRDEARREEVLAAAAPGDWRPVTAQPDLLTSVHACARRAAARGRSGAAALLWRALVCDADPARGGGGTPRAWVEWVVEAVRALGLAAWLDAPLLARALDVSRGAADPAAEAVLLAARGLQRVGAGERAGAGDLADALGHAAAAGDPALRRHLRLQAAQAHLLLGDARAAALRAEEALGGGEPALPLSSDAGAPAVLPERAVALLAWSRDLAGGHDGALALAQALASAAARTGRADVAALGDAAAALLHAARRRLEPARAHAEAALVALAGAHAPEVVWPAAVAAAWARCAAGDVAGACAALEAGARARPWDAAPLPVASLLLETLERLDALGAAAPGDVGLDAELGRLGAAPSDAVQALACRYRARRLARAGPDDAVASAEIDRLHARGVALLRGAAGDPAELGRSLEDAAGWARLRGRGQEASRLEAEADRVLASAGLGSASGPGAAIARAVAEIARASAGAGQLAAAWDRIHAGLALTLGIERSAWVEAPADAARIVAARGEGWADALPALLAASAPGACLDLPGPASPGAPDADRRVLVIPTRRTASLGDGWICLGHRSGDRLDGLAQPCLAEALGAAVQLALENVALRERLAASHSDLDATRRRLDEERRLFVEAPPPARSPIVGDSPALRRTLALVARVAPADTAVLVQGETGVGKELVAQELHRLSPRRAGPFVPVHIAALPRGLVASALFGHERGAFTGATERTPGRFELADGGTLFLDEIGELDPEDQVRLLRVLQDGTFERLGGTRPLRSSFRLVAATNRDLAAAVRAGTFRGDLYFRLAAFTIPVPSLRERAEDVPALALHFLEAVNRAREVRFEGIGERDMARLVAHPWPGNVRELAHVIERAALLSEPPRLRIPPLQADPPAADAAPRGTLQDAERRYLVDVLARAGGRIAGPGGAAELAGLKPSTLYDRLDALGLRAELRRLRAEPSPREETGRAPR